MIEKRTNYEVNLRPTVANNDFNWDKETLQSLGKLMASGRIVGYVGAGPSISARVPDWLGLCSQLLDWVMKEHADRIDGAYLHALIHQGQLLLFSQILENLVGKDIRRQIPRICRPPSNEPSPAHRAIATLPMPLVLTTNYDHLLQNAFEQLPPAYEGPRQVFDWTQGTSILRLLRRGGRGLIYTHGEITKPDNIILTKCSYRRAANEPTFRAVFKTLLSAHSFLFIGCGLTDPDIFLLLDEILEKCRLLDDNSEILHYALLPACEAHSGLIEHFRRDYGIATLVLPRKEDLATGLRLISAETAKHLSGRVIGHLPSEELPIVPTSSFSSQALIKSLMPKIIRYSGSNRGDVTLSLGSRLHVPGVRLRWNNVSTAENTKWEEGAPLPDTVMGSAFLMREEIYYVPDTSPPSALAESATVERVPYEEEDKSVRSELAIPIVSDGSVIGVVNVESYIGDAYRAGHVAFLRQCALQIGAFHVEALERNKRTRDARLGEAQVQLQVISLTKLLSRSDRRVCGLLYSADYVQGILEAAHENCPITFEFGHTSSFAARVFRDGKADFISDIGDSKYSQQVDLAVASSLGLNSGPLFGTPVFDHGVMSAVLVLWFPREMGSDADIVSSASGRMLVSACVNLAVASVARNGQESKSFDRLRAALEAIESCCTFDEVVKRATEAALMVGFSRARYWRKDLCSFECIHSAPDSYILEPGITETWDKWLPDACYSDYCDFVVRRVAGDPWARVQGPRMFNGKEDPNASRLDKCEKCDWLVAPLVIVDEEERVLIGYIGADRHPEKCTIEDDDETNWLQLGMSVIGVVAARRISSFLDPDKNPPRVASASEI